MRSLRLCIALALPAGAVAAQTYNAAAEFSPTANPSGVWSYGLRPNAAGTFTPFAFTAVTDNIDFWRRDLPFPDSYPAIGHNGTGETQFWGVRSSPSHPAPCSCPPGRSPPSFASRRL